MKKKAEMKASFVFIESLEKIVDGIADFLWGME
jgi:hypothetical protein